MIAIFAYKSFNKLNYEQEKTRSNQRYLTAKYQ